MLAPPQIKSLWTRWETINIVYPRLKTFPDVTHHLSKLFRGISCIHPFAFLYLASHGVGIFLLPPFNLQLDHLPCHSPLIECQASLSLLDQQSLRTRASYYIQCES